MYIFDYAKHSFVGKNLIKLGRHDEVVQNLGNIEKQSLSILISNEMKTINFPKIIGPKRQMKR